MIHRNSRGGRRLTIAVVLLVLAMAFPTLGSATSDRTLVPIGGGYTRATLQGFAQVVINHADGDLVHIVVIPSAYGDDPADREENIELAQERTDQIVAACNQVVEASGFEECTGELLLLFDRADAENPDNSAPLLDDETDGAYILGGDQTIAMLVLANSPAEAAMAQAYERGVVFGGNSAGAAVSSRDMLAGYTEDGWPWNAMQAGMIEVWWAGDEADDRRRGLAFASDKVILDQHFWERGRFGRLLAAIALSDAVYDGQSKIGVGPDWGTGVIISDDAMLHGVFGDYSVGIIDGESMNGSFAWGGAGVPTVQAHNIVTHIFAQHEDAWYDLDRRTMTVAGEELMIDEADGWDADMFVHPGNGTLVLAGDLLMSETDENLRTLLQMVEQSGSRRILLVAAGYEDQQAGRRAAAEYVRAAHQQGLNPFKYPIQTVVHGDNPRWQMLTQNDLSAYGAVVIIGGDQSQMAAPLADESFRQFVQRAIDTVPLVVTDQGMTAVMGDWYVNIPDPGTTDDYDMEDSFLIDYVTTAPGLGIVSDAAFEPRALYDYRWGRMYSLAMLHPETATFGIAEGTMIVMTEDGGYVSGERSVVALDGSQATFVPGDNGAFSLFNVLLDTYAPGDQLVVDRSGAMWRD